jgi:hypothetical protein
LELRSVSFITMMPRTHRDDAANGAVLSENAGCHDRSVLLYAASFDPGPDTTWVTFASVPIQGNRELPGDFRERCACEMTHRPDLDRLTVSNYDRTWNFGICHGERRIVDCGQKQTGADHHMESSLHRQLKQRYGGAAEDLEVSVDGFRIDAVVKGRLIEIQQASLSALRDKVRSLLERHRVTVVKPLASRKYLIRRERSGGDIVSARFSPTRETVFHLFEDLVHFVGVFPHPRLTLEVVLTEQEEHRISRARRRFRGPDYRVEDRLLVAVVATKTLRTAADLRSLLPPNLPESFTTGDLARLANIPRWLAQKMAYCLRKTGAIDQLGKQGRAWLYGIPRSNRRKPRRAA